MQYIVGNPVQYITRNPDVDKFMLLGMLNYEQLSMLNCANKYLNRNIHKHITKSRDLRNAPSEIMMSHHDGICWNLFTNACIAGNLSAAKKAMNIMIHDAAKFDACGVLAETKFDACGLLSERRQMLKHLFSGEVCGNGHLDIAQWLLRIDDTLIGDTAFSKAFHRGHMNVFLWLCEQGPIPIIGDLIDRDYYFAFGCGRFELSQMQLYYKMAKIDVHSVGNDAIQVACDNGKLHIAKWLWDISNEQIDIHTGNEYAFIGACSNGHLDVAQWLWKISNKSIDIGADDHSAFKGAYRNQHNNVAEWLCTLTDRYSIATEIVAKIKY